MSVLPEDDSYLRFPTVAAKFDVNVHTVHRWVREGKIKAVTIAGLKGKRIAYSEYVRFVNENYGPPEKRTE